MLNFLFNYRNINSKRRKSRGAVSGHQVNMFGEQVGDEVSFESFCSDIKDFVVQIIETDRQGADAAAKMRAMVRTKFHGLTEDLLQNSANKKYIIKNVIRPAWHPLLEQLYNLVKVQPGVTVECVTLQKNIKEFQEKVSSICDSDSTFKHSQIGKTIYSSFIFLTNSF